MAYASRPPRRVAQACRLSEILSPSSRGGGLLLRDHQVSVASLAEVVSNTINQQEPCEAVRNERRFSTFDANVR